MIQTFTHKNFSSSSLTIIDQANDVINEMMSDGYVLTLRQLYYQLVSQDLIPNTMASYKKVGNIVSDARLAGLIDWDAIEDRTRRLVAYDNWETPSEILTDAAQWFQLDKWDDQPNYVEVWIEKEALAGVFQRICQKLDIPLFACKGYTSQSEMYKAGRRLLNKYDLGQEPIIFHFGDHDPSGIDMTRDIFDRLDLFSGSDNIIDVQRIALNYDQIIKYKPPPNPAKTTDSRYDAYRSEHGNSSWELDALNPKQLSALVEKHVMSVRDEKLWNTKIDLETKHTKRLSEIALEEEQKEQDE